MELGSKEPGRSQAGTKYTPTIAWILVALAIIGGVILSVLALTASPGDRVTFRLDLIGYLVAVIAGAAFFAYVDRQRDVSRRKGKPRQPVLKR
ncbi:MAG TPA: hypothetical protein VGL53_27850 [Bryobacteraceae bacterium]